MMSRPRQNISQAKVLGLRQLLLNVIARGCASGKPN